MADERGNYPKEDVLVGEYNRLKRENLWFKNKYGPYIKKRGLHNWKNLFKKPTLMEWTVLFMIIMALFIAFAYQQDTKLCREAMENLDATCIKYKTNYISNNYTYASTFNLSIMNFSNEDG